MCNCQCSVVYYRQDTKRLVIQRQNSVEEELNTKKQSKMDAFIGFTTAVIDITKGHLQEMEDRSVGNAMSKASLDMIESRKLNDNNELRYELQRKIGPLSASIDNVSAATLRKKNRKKRAHSPF